MADIRIYNPEGLAKPLGQQVYLRTRFPRVRIVLNGNVVIRE